MKLTKRELTKRVTELEERVRQLEEAERQRASGPITIKWPQIAPNTQPVPWYPDDGTVRITPVPYRIVSPCNHEFPSHYYSPDGYYPCTKCGQSVFAGRTIVTCSAMHSYLD